MAARGTSRSTAAASARAEHARAVDHRRQAEEIDVRNPFLKKNPFMSLWLSGANRLAGSMRGHAAAHARRQATTATTKATQDMFDLWTAALVPARAKRKTRRRR
jgi:hypothetical protein